MYIIDTIIIYATYTPMVIVLLRDSSSLYIVFINMNIIAEKMSFISKYSLKSYLLYGFFFQNQPFFKKG